MSKLCEHGNVADECPYHTSEVMKGTPPSASTDNEQDEMVEVITRSSTHFEPGEEISVDGGKTWWTREQYENLQSIIAHHTKEAVAEAYNQAIDNCIAVIRDKQYEDAEELVKRMAELSSIQKGKS